MSEALVALAEFRLACVTNIPRLTVPVQARPQSGRCVHKSLHSRALRCVHTLAVALAVLSPAVQRTSLLALVRLKARWHNHGAQDASASLGGEVTNTMTPKIRQCKRGLQPWPISITMSRLILPRSSESSDSGVLKSSPEDDRRFLKDSKSCDFSTLHSLLEALPAASVDTGLMEGLKRASVDSLESRTSDYDSYFYI